MKVILKSICRQKYEKNSKKILLPIDTKTIFEFYNSYLRSPSRKLATSHAS